MIVASPARLRLDPRRVGAIALFAALGAGAGSAGREIGDTAQRGPGPRPPGGVWIRPGSFVNPGATIPAGPDDAMSIPPPELRRDLWFVPTRDCPQVMGSDPWPCLKSLQFDAAGRLVARDPGTLLAQAGARPVLVVVQGNLTTPEIAVNGGIWTLSWLRRLGALPPDAIVVVFDWPSQRVYAHDVRDLEEKARRSYVAGYHLARFIQAFPPGSRICLLGQSTGARVVPSALHLLGGGALNSQDHDPPVCLPGLRPDLHLRAVAIAGASDRHWLDPGERLDRALPACEAFLNLYNRCDEALFLYPFARRTDHHRALGRVGLLEPDLARLGPLALRYDERDMHPLLGDQHTLLGAVAHPRIAAWIAPYTWAATPAAGPR